MNESVNKVNIQQDAAAFKTFKRWLKGRLKFGPVTVVFTKKDGTVRSMLCTTNEKLIPETVHKSNSDSPIDFPVEKQSRKVNEDAMSVYDLEIGAWRSFRWDSVSQVRFEL